MAVSLGKPVLDDARGRDFDRILALLATDPRFEEQVLADPEAALKGYVLDEDELAVLQQYRRWRVYR